MWLAYTWCEFNLEFTRFPYAIFQTYLLFLQVGPFQYFLDFPDEGGWNEREQLPHALRYQAPGLSGGEERVGSFSPSIRQTLQIG